MANVRPTLRRPTQRIARQICCVCLTIVNSLEHLNELRLQDFDNPEKVSLVSFAEVVREQMTQWIRHDGRGIDSELLIRDEMVPRLLRKYTETMSAMMGYTFFNSRGRLARLDATDRTYVGEVLDLGMTLKDLFDNIQEPLEDHEPKIYHAVHRILTLLNGCRPLLPDQQRPSLLPASNPSQSSALGTQSRSADTSNVSLKSEKHLGLRAQLIGTTCLAFLMCLALTAFAFQAPMQKSKAPKADQGFYLVVASSVLQLLGFYTTMMPVRRHYPASAWKWSWLFTIVGSLSVLAAMPIYLWLQPIWSALLSIVASASQAFIVIQLVLLLPIEQREAHAKEE